MDHVRRRLLALGGSLALGRALPAAAGPAASLYRARAIVTGRRPETTIPGLARCLPQVLVRVSGDPRLAADPRVAELARKPEAAVTGYSYRDLYAFRPIKDEQGTRDRPYEMTVEYDPRLVDAMLAGLGSRPWAAERPRLVVFLAVRHIASSFVLTTETEAGELMRESFQDAAWTAALEVTIPTPSTVEQARLKVDTLPTLPLAALQTLVDAKAGQAPLAGTLVWRKDLFGWAAEWRVLGAGREHRWGIAGVNFDAAFRNGAGGAAQVLSGNGDPAAGP